MHTWATSKSHRFSISGQLIVSTDSGETQESHPARALLRQRCACINYRLTIILNNAFAVFRTPVDRHPGSRVLADLNGSIQFSACMRRETYHHDQCLQVTLKATRATRTPFLARTVLSFTPAFVGSVTSKSRPPGAVEGTSPACRTRRSHQNVSQDHTLTVPVPDAAA